MMKLALPDLIDVEMWTVELLPDATEENRCLAKDYLRRWLEGMS